MIKPLIAISMLLFGIQSFAQKNIKYEPNVILGHWTVSAVVGGEDNTIWIHDLAETQLNDARNMIRIPSFEMSFSDSICTVFHSDTTFHFPYSIDFEKQQISYVYEGEKFSMTYYSVSTSSKKKTKVILNSNTEKSMLLLESKKKR